MGMVRAWRIVDGRLERMATGEASAPPADAAPGASPAVVLVSPEEAAGMALGAVAGEVLHALPHAAICFVERDAHAAAGIVAMPSGERRQRESARFAFVLGTSSLVLVEDAAHPGAVCAPALERLAAGDEPLGSPAAVLIALFRCLLRDHPAALSRVREDFELFEEVILEGRERVNRAHMMEDSRRMLGLDTFYQGMSDIASTFAEEGGELVGATDRLRMKSLARQLDRLAARLESLQDYSLQVHGLYQESIDVRQNNVMQWLTVVTTIAMPLTVVTGWYGMNFPHMGLLGVAWGYAFVVALCAVIIVVEVAFFHRRGWLNFGGTGCAGDGEGRGGIRRRRRGRSRRGPRAGDHPGR